MKYAAKVEYGKVYNVVLPWSEVCMAMKLAGKTHPVLITERGAYVDSGKGPHITLSEAGIRDDGAGPIASFAAAFE